MNLFKNLRIVILLLLLLVFTYFSISPYIFKKSGVVVTTVDKESRCGNIREGDIITNILGSYIKNTEDFKKIEKTIKANEYATMVVNGGPGGCTAVRDGYLGLTVVDIPSKEVKFGIDIQGGITTTLKPEKELNKSEIENIVKILNKRVVVLNLPETSVALSNSFIKINSLSTEKISWLIATGKFEARIMEEVKLQDNVGKLSVGDNIYSVEVINNSLKINNSFYKINDSFELENIKFDVKNITENFALVEAVIFENKDITKVLTSGSINYNANAQLYEFSIPVEISSEASNRFAKIVKKMPTNIIGNKIVLNGFLVYYLDENLISQLNIPIESVRQPIKQISIIGFSTNNIDALNTKLKILSSIESGSLPVKLEIVRTEKYEPTLKVFSIEVLGFALGMIVLFVISIFFWRYKNIKFGLLIILLSLTEMILVFETISIAQQLEVVWTINLITIFGFIVVLISSIAQMIISSEQILKKKDLSISYKYKKLTDFPMILNLVIFIISFIFLFTKWRFFGLTLLTSFFFDILLIKPIYVDFIKKKIF